MSTRATWRSPWFVAGMLRKNSRTPNRMIYSCPRRRWKHFGCCCLMRLLGGRQVLEVAKSWWWMPERHTCTLLPNETCMWHSHQKCVPEMGARVGRSLYGARPTREMGSFSFKAAGEHWICERVGEPMLLSTQQQGSELCCPRRRLRFWLA